MKYQLRNLGPFAWSLGYWWDGLFLSVEDFDDYGQALDALRLVF